MAPKLKLVAAMLVGMLVATTQSHAAPSERRIALVIGNANYQAGALPTPANDAGLIAQTLQAAGFDVTGARDLDQESLRRAFREFLDKASSAGPETVAFIYLGGYGLQLEGENYFVPIDAKIARDTNVAAEAVRLSDYTSSLAALKLKAGILVLDLARTNPFAKTGTPLPGGLALVDSDQNMLIAYNSAPGTVAPDEAGPYSAYAQALAEMMREGGVRVEDLFDRVRLRVNETTKGAQVPWNVSKLQAPFQFFDRAADAPPPTVSREQTVSLRSKPLRDFSAQDAYLAAIDRDTLPDYEAFLDAYPRDPMAPRVRAIIAARREAITWRRSRNVNTPPAYWSYLRRYPRGAHSDDARRRLAYLSAAFDPPPSFAPIGYDVPPPPPEEVIYVERPVLVFDDPDFDFAPPPPPPVFFLPPRPVYFIDLPPPPPPSYAYILPVPDYAPVPIWVRRPDYVSPPPNNIIYNNIHNTVIVNHTTNVVTITNPQGQGQNFAPPPVPAAAPVQGAAPLASPAVGPSGVATGVAAAGVVAGAGAAALLAPSPPASVATKTSLAPSPPTQPLKPLIRVQQPSPHPSTAVTPASPGKPSADGKPVTPGTVAPAGGAKQPSGTPAPGAPGAAAPPLANGGPSPAAKSAVAPTPSPAVAPKPLGQSLPGANGQPLPPVPGAPPSAPPGAKPSAPAAAHDAGKPGALLPGANGQPLPAAVPGAAPPAGTKPLPAPVGPNAPATGKPGSSLPGTKGGPLPATSTPPSPASSAQQRQTPAAVAPIKPSPAARPAVARPMSPPAVARPTPPPPVARPTAPPIARPAPPPPPAARPAPPPMVRPVPPPPPAARPAPPPMARPAPSPPPVARPAPPPAARPAPPAGKHCTLPNGQPCPAPR